MKDDLEKELEELDKNTDSDNSVGYEENDNWEFEAEAPTLADTVLESDDYQIDIPAEKPKPVVKAAAAPVEEKAPTKSNAPLFVFVALICAIVIAVIAFFGYRYYNIPNANEVMNPGNVALTAGDTDISVGMYNFYYSGISDQYITYAAYQEGLDASKDFSKQMTTDNDGKKVTWAKRFENETIDQIQMVVAYYEAAQEAGIKLTKDQKKTINEQLKNLEDTALADVADDEKAALSDKEKKNLVNSYIAENFGENCGYETVKKMLTQSYLAQEYYTQLSVETKATDKEKQAYYKEHKDDFSAVKIAILPIGYVVEGEGLTQKQAVERANKYVGKIKSSADMKKYLPTVCKEYLEGYVAQGYFEDVSEAAEEFSLQLEMDITKSSEESFPKEAIDWAFSDKTKVNDTKVVVDEDNAVVYIVLKTSKPSIDDSDIYSVRHLLVMPGELDENGQSDFNFTKDEWAKAKKEADKILKEYNETGKTEYDFAKLAEKYSDDTESTSNGSQGIYGGLIDNIVVDEGAYAEEFEAWTKDKNRKYGDVEIVKTKFGYHLMFFVSKDKRYLAQCASNVIAQKQTDFPKQTKIVRNKKGMKNTKVAQPVEATEDDANISYDYDTEDGGAIEEEEAAPAEDTSAAVEETTAVE